jgi:signal transduction histidine kinase
VAVWGRIGLRTRLFLAIGAGALVVATVVAVLSRPMFVENMLKCKGASLLAIARMAAKLAPEDPSLWKDYAFRLQDTLAGYQVFLLEGELDSEGFRTESARLGVDRASALVAYGFGEFLSSPSPRSGGIYEALVQIRMPQKRALLGIRMTDREGASSLQMVWVLWLLALFLGCTMGILLGYFVGYLLLIRQMAGPVKICSKIVPSPVKGKNDLALIVDGIEALEKSAKQDRARVERLSFELKRMREDLKGAQATLLRAEKLASVGELAAGIAHEIGNPIGIIMGISDVLSKGQVDEKSTGALTKQISEAAERVHTIIKDLLAFARPRKDEGVFCDVGEVISATISLLRPQKRMRDVEVLQDVEQGGLLAEIRASQLQQVLVNLMLNAADAMEGKGRIVVRARKHEGSVFVEVEDDGPGIPVHLRERVFDPFYTTKPVGEGTGLGLAISAQIIRVYGGEITVHDATELKGALFKLRLWEAMR